MLKELTKVKFSTQEEWLGLRRQGIGGSDAAAICGLSPYKSPLQVYMEKIGEIDPPQNNRFMEWGKILEPIVADYFSRKTGLRVARINQVLVNPKRPFMLANLDRRIVGKREGLEIKTTSAWNAGRLKEGIPDEYAIQCHHYMAVTGWERWHLAVLIGGNDFRHFVIDRDEEIIENLISIEKRFWEEHVMTRIPPEPDWQDGELLSEMYPASNGQVLKISNNPDAERWVQEYKELLAQEKEVEKKKKAITNKLKALMGEFEVAKIGEHKVFWKTTRQTKFAVKKFQNVHRYLYSKYSYTSEYRRFSVK